jgi:hypothetical protein
MKKSLFLSSALNFIFIGFLTIFFIESCEELEPVNPADTNYTLKAPTLVSVQAITDVQVDLTWQNNEEHTEEFIVSRKRSGSDSYDSIAVLPKDILSYTDTSCILAVPYSYGVTSKVQSNQSALSNEWVTATNFPPPPSVSISAVSGSSVQISWVDSCDFESGYRIERDSGVGYTQIGEVEQNITTFTDSLVNYVTEYSYRVAGYTNSNISTYTYSGSAYAPIPAPSNLIVEPNSTTSVRLSWIDNCEFETGFIVLRDTGAGYETLEILGTDITEYIDETVIENISYTYVVDVFDQHSNYGRSNVAEIDFPNISTYLVPSQYSDISSAINVASTGDSIIVAAGVYYASSILVDKNLTIGSEYLLTDDSLAIVNTIIDGTGSFTQFNILDDVSIVGLSIINGGTSGSIDCADNLNLTIDHCKITQSLGNGINIGDYSSATISATTINTISSTGISFNVENTSLTIIGSHFDGNYYAIDNSGGCANSSILIDRTSITGSSIGIELSNSNSVDLTIRSSNINENSCAIDFRGNNNSIALDSVNILDNVYDGSGLEIVLNLSEGVIGSIRNSNFIGNNSVSLVYTDFGSAIDWYRCKIVGNSSNAQFMIVSGGFFNCIIEENNTSYYLLYTRLIENSVICSNNVSGIFFQGTSPIINSIIWNNSNSVYYIGTSIRYSNIQEEVEGIGNIMIDPQFSDSDYHLSVESPCIDSGNPSPEYNDLDGSRNDMGVYGGPNGGW